METKTALAAAALIAAAIASTDVGPASAATSGLQAGPVTIACGIPVTATWTAKSVGQNQSFSSSSCDHIPSGYWLTATVDTAVDAVCLPPGVLMNGPGAQIPGSAYFQAGFPGYLKAFPEPKNGMMPPGVARISGKTTIYRFWINTKLPPVQVRQPIQLNFGLGGAVCGSVGNPQFTLVNPIVAITATPTKP